MVAVTSAVEVTELVVVAMAVTVLHAEHVVLRIDMASDMRLESKKAKTLFDAVVVLLVVVLDNDVLLLLVVFEDVTLYWTTWMC